MATSKKQITLVLDTQAIEEHFFEDTSLYAIRFAEHPYHAIWQINNLLHTKFVFNNSYFTDNGFSFSQYQFEDIKNDLQHYIYSNRKGGSFMIRELRGFHFFWLVKGGTNRNKFMLQAQKKILEQTKAELFQVLDLENLGQKSSFLF